MSKCGLMLMWNWMTMSYGEFVEGWEISEYIQIHQDTHICRPDDGSSSVRSTGIRDRFSSYLQGTTKTSPCCWLHTLPPEPWESAEPVYSLYTAASLTGELPFVVHSSWIPWFTSRHATVESCTPLLDIMQEMPSCVSTCTVYERLNRQLYSL